MSNDDRQKLWDEVRKRIKFSSDFIHDSSQWYCEEWHDCKGTVMNALVKDITTMFADHYEPKLAARRAECERLRELYREERCLWWVTLPIGEESEYKADTEANLQAAATEEAWYQCHGTGRTEAAGGEGKHEVAT